MTIQKEKVVSFDYTLTLESGEVADTSKGRNPLNFLVGSGQIIPGLESEMFGMSIGDSKVVKVEPKSGYGEKDPSLVQTIERSKIPESVKISVGEKLKGQTPEGHVVEGEIIDINEQFLQIDFNHPLAGQVLMFDIKIVDIRDATPEELSHGHAH